VIGNVVGVRGAGMWILAGGVIFVAIMAMSLGALMFLGPRILAADLGQPIPGHDRAVLEKPRRRLPIIRVRPSDLAKRKPA
jgi:hypothetical protein